MAQAKSMLEQIQRAVSTGEVGNYRVRSVEASLVKVETLNGTHSWIVDTNTGLCFSTITTDVLTLVKNSLVTAKHANFEIEIVCVDRASKVMERFYRYYPLSTQVEAFEGTFEPTKLNNYLERNSSPATPEEIAGLPSDANGTSARVFNVSGSVANDAKGSAFDRVLRGEWADVYFSSTTGAFRVQKHAKCRELYAMFPDGNRESISNADMLDGLAAAPRVSVDEAFERFLNTVGVHQKR